MSLVSRTAEFLTRAYDSVAEGVTTGKRRRSSGESRMAGMLTAGGVQYAPAQWAGSKYEYARRYRLWNYVAIRCIANEFGCHPPHVARVVRQKDLQGPDGAARRKMLLPRSARLKAMAPVQPHEELEPVDSDHALYRLLQNPNGPDVSFSFWNRSAIMAECTGEVYWWKVRNGAGRVMELWPLFSQWVQPVPGKNRMVDAYKITPIGTGTSGVRPMYLDPEDVVPILNPSPTSFVAGWSPIMAGAEWTDTSESLDASRWYEMENGTFPGTILKFDPKYFGGNGPGEPEMKRLRAQYEAKTKGKENAGRVVGLPPGMDVAAQNRTPVEMNYLETSDQLQSYVMSGIHQVSKTIAGFTEEVSYASSAVSLANFLNRTMAPKQTFMGQVATEHLAREFGENLVIYWPDRSPDDRVQKLAEMNSAAANGGTCPNDWRRFMDLPLWEHGGDDPLVGGRELPYGTGTTQNEELLWEPSQDQGDGESKGKDEPNGKGNRIGKLFSANGSH